MRATIVSLRPFPNRRGREALQAHKRQRLVILGMRIATKDERSQAEAEGKSEDRQGTGNQVARRIRWSNVGVDDKFLATAKDDGELRAGQS